MPYCSLGDLQNAIGLDMLNSIADRDKDGVPDPGAVSAAITWGEMQINMKLANRYSVPFATAPTVISYMCVDFAKWNLLNGIAQPEGFADGIKSQWDSVVREHRKTLSMYATGPFYIPGTTPSGSLKGKVAVGINDGTDTEKVFTETRQEVGGNAIDVDEAGSMDVW